MTSAWRGELPGQTLKDKQDATARSNALHKHWVDQTEKTKGRAAAWRPKRVFRRATAKWICYIDNQLRVSGGKKGLVYALPDESDVWKPANWRTWPSGSSGQDQGSDGVAAVFCLLYKASLRLNIVPWFEWSHGACRDLDLVIDGVGKKDFQYLLLIVLNEHFGPDKDVGMRFAPCIGFQRCWRTGSLRDSICSWLGHHECLKRCAVSAKSVTRGP